MTKVQRRRMPQKAPTNPISQNTGKIRINVLLQPRASRDEVLGWNEDGALRARVKAAPVDGAANAALIQLVAKQLGIAKSKVVLVSGATSRNKIVEIQGVAQGVLKKVMDGHPGRSK